MNTPPRLIARPIVQLAAALLLAGLAQGAAALDVEGRLHWAQRLELATPVSGVIDAVHAHAGQRVEKGAPLLTLDPRPFQARLARAAAAMKAAKVAYDEAKREHQRAVELYDRAVLSNREMEVAESAFAEADAIHARARADHQLAQLDLEHSRLTAPFDAWVVERRAEAGETVVSALQARTLLVIAEAGRMVARAGGSAEQAAALAPGGEAEVAIDAQRLKGTIRAVALEPREGTGLYTVEVEFASDQPLRAGRRVAVVLP